MKKTILILAALLATISASAQITTRIEGRIGGDAPKEGTLLFGEYNQDYRIKPAEEIPIRDGRFSYEWTAKDTTAFSLCFKDEYDAGSWNEYTVFSEGGTLRVAIAQGDPDMEISDNGLTKQFYSLRKKLHETYRSEESLKKEGKYYTAETQELMRRLGDKEITAEERNSLVQKIQGMMDSGEALTHEGKLLGEEKVRLDKVYRAAKDSAIARRPNILGLYFLAYDIRLNSFYDRISPELEQAAERYESVYPEHPLSLLCRSYILAQRLKEHNGRIPDLRARDLDGNEVNLRALVKSRFTLLDLWASWCAPCRRHSKELIPVYEEFKSKGFSVLAVAREYKKTDAMKRAMKQDGYPWTSYVDLGDEFKDWQQMGVGNAGGSRFLLDSEGKVLMTNPTAEEVREYLKENLQ